MGKNKVLDTEKILVKVDQNNLIYIDPNSVVDGDNNISPRNIKQENLVFYVNLEADIVPRSILLADNDKNTLLSIAKGTLNFLSNQDGQDYDTNWTEAYVSKKETTKKVVENGQEKTVGTGTFYQSDSSGQSFGIDSITITTKGQPAIPQVSINFVDVRGKTLFESAPNSPYTAFFHIPWPIFYLTLKGYYGKAIRYRLHLVKFSSRYNDTYGNFEISTTFVGSTFAYLNDIPLKAMLNCPYMYPIDIETIKSKNEKTGQETQTKVKSSRGFAILKSVYNEYKRKKLIEENFPEKTLREVISLSQSIDVILEQTILDGVLDKNIFSGIRDFETRISDFQQQVQAWQRKYLTANFILDENDFDDNENKVKSKCYEKKDNKTSLVQITGNTQGDGSLEYLIVSNTELLKNSELFNKEIMDAMTNKKSGGADFSKTTIMAKPILGIEHYYIAPTAADQQYRVKIDKLNNHINDAYKTFVAQREKMEQEVETKMNEIIQQPTQFYENGKYKKGGLGFKPTIRNIFAIILANAETYIRLMKEVHNRAIEKGAERATNLNGFTDESKGDLPIYPWPEVKKKGDGGKRQTLVYPADPDLVPKLKSDDATLWPEVEFVESFLEISTNIVDTNTKDDDPDNDPKWVFPNEDRESCISSIATISSSLSYVDKSPSSFLYEIWERALAFTLIDSFDENTLEELSNIEFENIQKSLYQEKDLTSILEKITSETALNESLKKYSEFVKYAYKKDQLPNTKYIKEAYDYPFSISQYELNLSPRPTEKYNNTNTNLVSYRPEKYRKSIYPFNSPIYLSYIGAYEILDSELNFHDFLNSRDSNTFISSPVSPSAWVQKDYVTNLFRKKLQIDDSYVNIMNTPYFHQQLYSDYFKISSYGKYAGSAYLLLNSLPFNELQDLITFDKDSTSSNSLASMNYPLKNKSVRMSSLFREIGSTHYVPYHLVLKWGSIYHRYKTYIMDGVDILSGAINSQNITQKIDEGLFFDKNSNSTFTIGGESVNISNKKDVGIHPYYDAIFCDIVNGFTHYDIKTGATSFNQNVTDNKIIETPRKTTNGLTYWCGLVDNSKYDKNDLKYTILPSDGANSFIDDSSFDTNVHETNFQKNFRCIFDNETVKSDFDGKKFPGYNQYHKSYVTNFSKKSNDNKYIMEEDYRKVIDLIATFNYKILDEFEDLFLKFSSARFIGEVTASFPKIKYTKFQDLLKDIVTITKKDEDEQTSSTFSNFFLSDISYRQLQNLEYATKIMLNETNMLKITIANPKEIDPYVFHGFAKVESGNTFSYDKFYYPQLNDANRKFIELYIGEDMDKHYENFFVYNDIELNEFNIQQFRPLAMIYAGYVTAGNPYDDSDGFKKYIKDNIFLKNKTSTEVAGSVTRLSYFLNNLTKNFSKLKLVENTNSKITIGFNTKDLKLEMYNTFKSFNDKWIGGNSIGQRLLLEEFLFLDKANKDIGNDFYLNLSKLTELGDSRNDKANLYSVIGILINQTGLDMRPLPAYVNFYGANATKQTKVMPSRKVAENLFGTFMEVDYMDSSPKIIIQLVGPSSKHTDNPNPKYNYSDDSFDISSPNNNPLIITLPDYYKQENLQNSNKVVAFEVSFGDEYNGIFKGVQLDQNSIKNTSESFVVLENIARSESGAGAYNVDIGLFEYYRQASYTCEVTCMGNAIIQPTMYFYLKNIPMFKGSYWITEVSHTIRPNTFTTMFKGSRIPRSSLPDPKDSFVSSYRSLFDKLRKNTLAKIDAEKKATTNTEIIINTGDGTSTSVDVIRKSPDEVFPDILFPQYGISDFCVPFNGKDVSGNKERYIQKIKRNAATYFRGIAFEMGNSNYPIDANTNMSLIAKYRGVGAYTWGQISGLTTTHNFFATRFAFIDSNYTPEKTRKAKTTFISTDLKKTVSVKEFTLNTEPNNNVLECSGPIHETPYSNKFSIGLSRKLMYELGLKDGDPVYFNMD